MKHCNKILAACAALTLSSVSAIAGGHFPFGGDENYYACYQVNPNPRLNAMVDMKIVDQFGKSGFEVLEVTRLCNPILEGVVVNRSGSEEQLPPSKKPDLHYICFNTRLAGPSPTSIRVETENLLGTQDFRVDQLTEVCIPTFKRH